MKEMKLKSNTINVMQVFHDEWCKSDTKKGRNAVLCDCSPDIKIVETDGTEENVEAALGIKPKND
tara:strand:- start:872 stop:1066 length:195 start_codon:yes stop_codon:yes gene_type:complete